MKRFLPILIVMILVVSMIGITAASAGITGNSEVVKGKSYTYTVKVSATGIFMMGNVKCDGVFSGSTVQFDAGSGGSANTSLSATVKITVKVSSSATPGQTGRIYIDNASYSYYDESGNIKEKSISGSKTATVVIAAPVATRDPNATPKPLEGWDIAAADVEAAEPGSVVKVVMTDDYNIPESLLEKAIENKNILQIDFGTYTCTIDPAKLTDVDGIKKLNLKLEFEKAEGLSEIAGGKDIYQLHFGHDGELPGLFSFTFKATENKPGDTVYLYYYYGMAGVVEGIMTAVVDEDGMVTFDIYHCSSYFVTGEVLEGAQSNFDTESKAQIDELTVGLSEKQTEVDDANAQIAVLTEQNTALEAELIAAQQEASEFKDMAEKALAEPEIQTPEFSLVVLIAAVAAAVMLTLLLTMLITKSGLFKRSEKVAAVDGEIRYQPEQMTDQITEEAPEEMPEQVPATEEPENEEENKTEL